MLTVTQSPAGKPLRSGTVRRALALAVLASLALTTAALVAEHATAVKWSCDVTGTRRADVLRGGPGDDTICGLGGNDVVYGRGGADSLRGGAGNDRLFAGGGRDMLDGQAGNDVLVGGRGIDVLLGRAGNDTLRARDRMADHVDGGPGDDLARSDLGDRVYRVERRS